MFKNWVSKESVWSSFKLFFQSFKDKAFDVHIKLINEKYLLPQIAFGLRDFAGTGRIASEYIVSTKSIGNFDVTLGLGWGLLGTAGGISNPFKSIHESFGERSSFSGQGGEVNFSNNPTFLSYNQDQVRLSSS